MKTKLELNGRYLCKTRFGSFWEGNVLEFSPSNEFVKIKNIHGEDHWHKVCEIDVVEKLDYVYVDKSEGMCDCCAGTGKPVSGLPCMCGGSGKMIDAVPYLRSEVFKLQQELVILNNET